MKGVLLLEEHFCKHILFSSHLPRILQKQQQTQRTSAVFQHGQPSPDSVLSARQLAICLQSLVTVLPAGILMEKTVEVESLRTNNKQSNIDLFEEHLYVGHCR